LSSGLSIKALYRQHNLDRSTLPRRLRQRQNPTAQNPQTSGWARVELASEPDRLPVATSGVTQVVASRRPIELARTIDAATLRQLLGLLESR